MQIANKIYGNPMLGKAMTFLMIVGILSAFIVWGYDVSITKHKTIVEYPKSCNFNCEGKNVAYPNPNPYVASLYTNADNGYNCTLTNCDTSSTKLMLIDDKDDILDWDRLSKIGYDYQLYDVDVRGKS